MKVEWKKLGDLLDYEQPSKYIVKSVDYNDEYNIPVLTAGQSFILGYTNETEGVYVATKNNPVIIFDDFTTSIHLVDFSFKVKSSAVKILTAKEGVNIRLVYYLMLSIRYFPKEHSRQWISTYSQFEIAYPLSERDQLSIFEKLDAFTSLIASLESELDLRRKQYEHYRNQLLDWSGEWKTLKDVCSIMNGKDYKKYENGEVPVYGSGGIIAFINTFAYDKPSVLLPRKGSLDNVFFVDTCFWTVDTIYWTKIKEIIMPKYLYYYMAKQDLSRYNMAAGGVPSLTQEVLYKIPVPVPPLATQQSIVEKLDAFEQLVAKLEEEIALRKKQYEYYREKLLTFE